MVVTAVVGNETLKRGVFCSHQLLHVSFFFLILEGALVLLGRLAIAQVNNSPRANVFPAEEANFGQAMYRSLERSPQDTRDGFDLYSTQASFAWPRFDLARPLRRIDFRPPASSSKSAGFVSLAVKASLVSISDAILFLRY